MSLQGIGESFTDLFTALLTESVDNPKMYAKQILMHV
ncbi:protein of unknown function [Pararobbsia alpina]